MPVAMSIQAAAMQDAWLSGPASDANAVHHTAPVRSSQEICRSATGSSHGRGAAKMAAMSVMPGWWELPHSNAAFGPIA